MTDEQYVAPHLVGLYDALNPLGADTDFWSRLAGVAPNRILDIGCGTGLLAIRLAERGHEVTGVDRSPAMLERAGQHDVGSLVTWQHADARTLRLGRCFDSAFMTGHVVQMFLDDDDVNRVFETAYSHLVPGGTLAFDSRNPTAQAWVRWNRRETLRTVETALAGPVSVWHDTVAVEDDIIALETSHAFLRSGELTVTKSRLSFRTLDALRRRLAGAGFADIDAYGDWDGGPVTASSPELIVVARRGPGQPP